MSASDTVVVGSGAIRCSVSGSPAREACRVNRLECDDRAARGVGPASLGRWLFAQPRHRGAQEVAGQHEPEHQGQSVGHE